MPSRTEVETEITMAPDNTRRHYLKQLQAYTKRDTILYGTAFTNRKGPHIPPHLLAIEVDDIQGFMASLHGLQGDKLDLVLHSPGGSLEAAEQIVNYLRSKYSSIRAIVPQNAMSAATMIACACDEIVMGKQSAIGPIDPQITFPTQHGPYTAPAQALLNDFEQAKQEVAQNQRVAALWVAKMKDFPPGIFNICRDTIELAKQKVKDWLSSYMFRGRADAVEKANAIGNWLGDADQHKTHGHPISIGEARTQGLNVTALEEDQRLQDGVLSVFHATAVTFGVTDCVKLVENHKGKGWYYRVQLKIQ